MAPSDGGERGHGRWSVLIIFAGPGDREDSLANMLRHAGFRVVVIDTKIGGHAHDVTRRTVQQALVARTRAGEDTSDESSQQRQQRGGEDEEGEFVDASL